MDSILTLVLTTVFVFIIQQLCIWALDKIKASKKGKGRK